MQPSFPELSADFRSLIEGTVLQAIMFIIIAALLGTAPKGSYAYGTAAIVMLFIYYGGNSLTWLGTSWA